MKNEKESLEGEIWKIREGAIDAIMEKEKVIMELREALFEKTREIDDCLSNEKALWEEMQRSSFETYERMILELQ